MSCVFEMSWVLDAPVAMEARFETDEPPRFIGLSGEREPSFLLVSTS